MTPDEQLSARWRVGNRVKLNVYQGDRPAFQCHTPEEAARVVELLNAGESLFALSVTSRTPIIEITEAFTQLSAVREALYPEDTPEERSAYTHFEIVDTIKEYAFAFDKLSEVMDWQDRAVKAEGVLTAIREMLPEGDVVEGVRGITLEIREADRRWLAADTSRMFQFEQAEKARQERDQLRKLLRKCRNSAIETPCSKCDHAECEHNRNLLRQIDAALNTQAKETKP